MFIEKLTDEELLEIARKSTIIHYPENWHKSIVYQPITHEMKKVREKPLTYHTPCVTDANGKPIKLVLPIEESVEYPTKDQGEIYFKIVLKDKKFPKGLHLGYVHLSDMIITFCNIMLRNSLKKNVDFIAREYPPLIQIGNGVKFDISKQEYKQAELTNKIFKEEMSAKFDGYQVAYEKHDEEMKQFFKDHNL